MKKIVALLLTMVMLISCFGMVASARVGDVIGTALHTDIVVYINNWAIPSYIVNGQSVVVAEDLRNFGFDVIWDGNNRRLDIYKNYISPQVVPQFVGKGYTTGSKYANILETDIVVYANGQRINSFALNGYTMVPVEELTMLGEVNWVPSERALKMWVDNINMLDYKQPVSLKYYPGTSAPDFGWITESVCLSNEGLDYFYSADGNDVQRYIDYIESQGWRYQLNLQDEYGIWYLAYINKSKRTGIAIAEADGFAYVQVKTNIDYWKAQFE